MSDLELTSEEQTALAAMQETPPETETPKQEAPQEPAPVEQPETPEQPEKPESSMVPHQAMHAEREARKAEQEAHRATQAQLRELQEKVAQLEAPAPDNPEHAGRPDPVLDPEAYAKWEADKRAEIEGKVDALRQEREQEAIRAQRQSDMMQAQDAFREKQADYDDAANHLMQARIGQLAAQGLAEADIKAQLSKDINAIYDAAKSVGMNPAHLAYIRAQELGYQRKQPDTGEAERVAALAKAQESTASLSTAGGTSAPSGITAESLAAMSEAEFAKVSDEDIRRAMGG